MIAVLLAIIGFGSSDNLAGAYGIAVTGTMTITTVLLFFVMYYHWKWKLFPCLLISAGFFLECPENHEWWLVPAGARCRTLYPDAHMAKGQETGR